MPIAHPITIFHTRNIYLKVFGTLDLVIGLYLVASIAIHEATGNKYQLKPYAPMPFDSLQYDTSLYKLNMIL